VLEARATEMQTPTLGDFRTARADIRFDPPQFTADILGERPGDAGAVQIVAEGTVPMVGPADILLQHARLDIDDERWVLVQPALIQWEGVAGVVVTNVEFRDEVGEGRVLVDGRILPLAMIDARLELEAFPIGRIQELLGVETPYATGVLWTIARVSGPGDAPVIEADFRLVDGQIQEVPVTLLEGRLRYAAEQLEIEATALLEDAGTADAAIALPLVLQLDPALSVVWLEEGVVSGFLVADSLALGPLAELTPLIRNASGFLVGRMDLSGTVQAPDLAGRFTLFDGAATFPDINQRYREGYAELELAGRQIYIREMRARSDGWATGSGVITLEDLRTPIIDAVIELNGFRALGVPDRRDAAVSGTISLFGPLLAGATASGQLFVEDGDVIAPIDADAPPVDFLDPGVPGARFMDPLGPVAADPGWLQQLQLQNLIVTFAENVWFQAPDGRVQLAGTLTINRVADRLIIVGTLEGTRGQYVLQAGPIVRRFDVIAATVRFLGTGELNPAIDFTARRRLIDPAGRNLEIDVRITGTVLNPQIALASADAAMVPQSELLSILIFGQPSFALGGGGIPGEAVLEQTLVGGLAELAGLEIEQAVIQELGLPLDIFQIRFGPGRFGGFGTPQILLGRELTTDIFLTVETGLEALFADTEGGSTTWAARLEWAIDPRTTLRTGFEPVRQGRILRGLRFALPARDPRQQFFLELRRRWYY
jgi:translocation and assembly module TamB